jgi:undecaprenyl-diphosphatase
MLQLDRTVLAWVVAHRVHALDGLVWAVSAAGRFGIVWLAIGLGLTLTRRLRPSGLLQLALALVLAQVVVNALKPVVGRERPFAALSSVQVIGSPPKDASFPSGHAATAASGGMTLIRLVPEGGLCWSALALLMAYSRLYLGVHYPLDVLAGIIVGLICAALAGLVERNRAQAQRLPSDSA